MSLLVAILGWLVAGALLAEIVRVRRRLELVARAEHELRGPLTAFSLALDSARGTPVGRRLAVVLESELLRARAGLADLTAARLGRRAPAVRERVAVERLLRSSAAAWQPAAVAAGRRVRVRSGGGAAVVRADRERVAQALGNVISNAVEHGSGDVSVEAARRAGGLLRIEVSNPVGSGGATGRRRPPGERGRGLSIAASAVEDAGGKLGSTVDAGRAVTALDLPLEP